MDERSERLKQARIAAGFDKPSEAAERFGWNVNTYKSNENGNAPFSFRKAKEYASAFGVRTEWLYDAQGPAKSAGSARPTAVLTAPVGELVNLADLRAYIKAQEAPKPAAAQLSRMRRIDRRVPVVGDVAAGLWREAPHRLVDSETETLPVDVPGYERAQLRAWRVVGPSMNLFYPEGRYVVTAHPAEAGLRNGDHVVVERHKADLVEVTLKEFVIDEAGRAALWPRSDHPDFQEPVYLKGYDEQDQTRPEIVGVVVGDYGKRERPPISRRA